MTEAKGEGRKWKDAGASGLSPFPFRLSPRARPPPPMADEPSDLLPRIEAFDGTRVVVFRTLRGRPQGRGQEVELTRRPGFNDYTVRQLGLRAEPFSLEGMLYASRATYGDAGGEATVLDDLNAMRGGQVLLVRPGDGTLVCVLIDVKETDKLLPPIFVDPHFALAGGEGADRLLLVELTLVVVRQPDRIG